MLLFNDILIVASRVPFAADKLKFEEQLEMVASAGRFGSGAALRGQLLTRSGGSGSGGCGRETKLGPSVPWSFPRDGHGAVAARPRCKTDLQGPGP